jgi:hypothetical protein
MMNNPRNSMSTNRPSAAPAKSYTPIASGGSSSTPNPAIIGLSFDHVSPKSFFNGLSSKIIMAFTTTKLSFSNFNLVRPRLKFGTALLAFLHGVVLTLLYTAPAVGQVSNVSVVGTTPTQVVLHATIQTPASCTFIVSTQVGLSPVVNDANATLFTNANTCNRSGSSTQAGAIVNGTDVYLVVGTRALATDLSANVDSRALQMNTTHYYSITQGNTVTGSFTTSNYPNGVTYGERLLVDASGNYLFPTFPDTSGFSFVDPLTGGLICRLGLSGDTTGGFGNPFFWDAGATKISTAVAVAGGYYLDVPTDQGFYRFYWVNPNTCASSFLGVGQYATSGEIQHNYTGTGEGNWDDTDAASFYTFENVNGSAGILSASRVSNVVTITTDSNNHHFVAGQVVCQQGMAPAGATTFNGCFTVNASGITATSYNYNQTAANDTATGGSAFGKIILIKLTYTGDQSNQAPNTTLSSRLTVTNMTPSSGSTLQDLLVAFDATFDPVKYARACSAHGLQVSSGHAYLMGTCQLYQQNSPGWNFVVDLGNKSPLGSGGTLSVVAAMPMFSVPACRWCGHHSTYYTGNQPTTYVIPQVLTHDYTATGPYEVALTASVADAVTTAFPSLSGEPLIRQVSISSISRTANVTSVVTSTPHNCDTSGSGCTILGVADATFDKQNFTPVSVPDNTHLTYNNTGSNGSSSGGTVSWGLAPDGDPHLNNAAVGDFFLFEDASPGELVKITAKNSATNWTVARGCHGIGDGTTPCDGTNAIAHANGARMAGYCITHVDVWWNFLANPSGNDATNTNVIQEFGADMHGGHRVTRNFYTTGTDITEDANVRLGAFPGQYNTSATRVLDPSTPFAGISGYGNGNAYQKHPGYDQSNASTAEQGWFNDVWPYTFTNYADSAALVGGKSNTYLYTLDGANPFNIYKLPYFGVTGNHQLLDISGVGSVLGDTAGDNYKMCVVHAVNECISGSTVGQIYFNVPALDFGFCQKGENGAGPGQRDICIQNTIAYGQSVNQFGMLAANQTGTDGNGVPIFGAGLSRVLARQAVGGYRQVGGYANAHSDPSGQVLFFPSRFASGIDADVMVKVPPQPGTDGVSRLTYVQKLVTVTSLTGATAAWFEFGSDPVNHFCTQRAEICTARSTYSDADPFRFKTTDTKQLFDCTTSCTAIIPCPPLHVCYGRATDGTHTSAEFIVGDYPNLQAGGGGSTIPGNTKVPGGVKIALATPSPIGVAVAPPDSNGNASCVAPCNFAFDAGDLLNLNFALTPQPNTFSFTGYPVAVSIGGVPGFTLYLKCSGTCDASGACKPSCGIGR